MKKSRNDDKTRKYQVKASKVSKKENKKELNKKDKTGKKKHTKLKKFIIINLILFIVLCLTGIGIFAGIFFSDKWEVTKEDLEISRHNTEVYDIDGKKIAELSGEENRKIITMAQMGDYLPAAFVAIEDERYYSHFGIDIKRTAGAIVTYVLNGGESSFGGSTITQQLVKNMMNDDASEGAAGVERKIREWSRAYQIEQMLSKSQILELYLNKIFMGSTVYGVESASQYYFSKSAKDLKLEEAAFIAGINHSPNSYNPFTDEDNDEIIKERTKTVLEKMKSLRNTEVKELEILTKITEEEYDKAIEAVDKGLKFKKGASSDTSDISFHTAAAIDQVAQQLAKEKDVDYDTARAMVFNNGYKLYTTQDSSIQDIMEEEYLKEKYIEDATTEKGIAENAHSQSAMVIIDHKNGQVVGCVGGLGDDVSTLNQNRATQSYRQPGSAMKPIAAVGPALEEEVITAATLYDDSPTSFGGESFTNSTGYPGIIPVKAAIERSSNIVNMKILSNVGIETAVEYVQEFGLTEYNKDEDAGLALALGGTTNGASPLQMAAAYATIANGGEYIEPTFYTKLENSSGKVVLEPNQEKRRVLSEQNAYVLINILKAPVYGFYGSATAYGCEVPGMETGAKTGTTTDDKDKWLCGFTPYYAAATWFGYDEPEGIYGIAGVSNPSKTIWSAVMDEVHEDLDEASFERPSGIVTAKICETTGKVATDKCKNTYSEIFASGTVPSACDGHEAVKLCKESKKLATEFCPKTEEKTYAVKPEKERNASWSTSAGKKYNEVKDTCTLHTEETMNDIVPNVVGKIDTEAKDELIGFKIQVIFKTDTSKADGIVLEQSLKAGESVKKGSTIILTINDLPVVEEPEEPEEPSDESVNNPTDEPIEDPTDNPTDVPGDTQDENSVNETNIS